MLRKIGYIIIIFFLSLQISYAQDDSEEEVAKAKAFVDDELQEEKRALNFEKIFIESIQQRSIENYDKSLELLLACKAIFPNNVAMLFQMAKNHFDLKQYIEAHHFCNKALEIEPDNFWILELSREIFIKEQNYREAIQIQKTLYKQKESEAGNLLRLYYYVKAKQDGKDLLIEIENKNIHVTAIGFYQKYFNTAQEELTQKQDNNLRSDKKDNKLNNSINKDFTNLIKKLEKQLIEKQYISLLKDSEEALSLYPAQAVVYLYKGSALNGLSNYKDAIEALEIGIDFVFDDAKLSKRFYNALIIAYKGINNTTKTNYYKQLVQKL